MQNCDACIVTYNSAETIGRLLRSLDEEPSVARVRILDNASKDQTIATVRVASENLKVPVSAEWSRCNLGFPAAVNRLFKNSTSDVVAIVNPDIELAAGALSTLVETVLGDTSIGLASCRLMTRDGRAQSEPARSRPRLSRLLAGHVPRGLGSRLAPHRRDASYLFTDRDVECTSGALMVLRRELLDEIGYLDESVFMYLEDIDFSARVRRAGYRIRYIGTAWSWHDSGVSARNEPWLYSLLPKVWLTYLRRYGYRHERLAARPVLFLVCAIDALLRLGHGQLPRDEFLAMWHVVSFRPVETPAWS